MTDAKFTPGPWEADVALGCVVAPNDTRAPKGRRLVVADTEYEGTQRMLPADEREANTRLIAAAPDLYEALKMLVADVADYPAWQRPCHALNNAIAALAKAASSQTDDTPQVTGAQDDTL